jgi:hypothetical protein
VFEEPKTRKLKSFGFFELRNRNQAGGDARANSEGRLL